VEEPYKGAYTVESRRVLDQNEGNEPSSYKGDEVSLYRIDGVIASDEELASFRAQPFVGTPGTVTERTVTTYRTPVVSPLGSGRYADPGDYPSAPVVYTAPGELSDDMSETTTVTHTTITK
jgi:hypothetical protein